MTATALTWTPALTTLAAAAWLACLAACAHGESATPGATPRPAPAALPSAAAAADDAQARAARAALVDRIATGSPAVAPAVLAVLRATPRHLFMPGASPADAYADHAFPIGHRQTISQPTVVAIMTDALRLHGDERVLEIGTGSGYQAAVLSRLAREVFTIEIVARLGEDARDRLARLGYDNVHVRIGDGYGGWPEQAPFDRVLLTAAPPEVPQALFDQLVEGGILVAPVGVADDQVLARWTKRGGRVERELLGSVRFVPMVPATPGHRP